MRFRKQWLWALLNVAGMILFLRVGSALWVPPGEEGMPGGPGDAFYFFLIMVPILLAFLVLDVVALGWILFRTPRAERLARSVLWLAVATLWCAAVGFDLYKGFRTINPEYGGLILTIRPWA